MPSGFHRRIAAAVPDSPEDVRDRLARHTAGGLAVADRVAKFPELTEANVDEAIEFQRDRFAHHFARLLGCSRRSWSSAPHVAATEQVA